jgi:hypothetical protein
MRQIQSCLNSKNLTPRVLPFLNLLLCILVSIDVLIDDDCDEGRKMERRRRRDQMPLEPPSRCAS